jgi:hypothetical protein
VPVSKTAAAQADSAVSIASTRMTGPAPLSASLRRRQGFRALP